MRHEELLKKWDCTKVKTFGTWTMCFDTRFFITQHLDSWEYSTAWGLMKLWNLWSENWQFLRIRQFTSTPIPPVSQNKTHVSNVQPWIMKHGRIIIYLNMVRFKMMVSFRTQWYSSEEVLSCFFVVHGHWSLRLVTGPGIQVRKPRTYTTASYPNQMSGTCWNNSNRRDPQWTWTSSTPPQHQSLLENCTINPARSLPVQRCSLEDRMGFALKIQGFHVTCRSWFAWQCDHNFS